MLLFELGVTVRQEFRGNGKDRKLSRAYANSNLRNYSFLAVRDTTGVSPFRLWAFINVRVQVLSKECMTEDELPLSSPS